MDTVRNGRPVMFKYQRERLAILRAFVVTVFFSDFVWWNDIFVTYILVHSLQWSVIPIIGNARAAHAARGDGAPHRPHRGVDRAAHRGHEPGRLASAAVRTARGVHRLGCRAGDR